MVIVYGLLSISGKVAYGDIKSGVYIVDPTLTTNELTGDTSIDGDLTIWNGNHQTLGIDNVSGNVMSAGSVYVGYYNDGVNPPTQKILLNGTTGDATFGGTIIDTDATNGTLFVNGTTAQLTNSVGTYGHGLFVGAASTTLTGGTNTSTWTLANGSTTLDVAGSTGTAKRLINATTNDNSSNPQVTVGSPDSGNLTVNDNGVTLDNHGSPARLRGVANGVDNYDAVNMQQLNRLTRNAYSGIAQIAAMTAIPAPAPGHRYAIGVGVGTYGGEQGLAAGVKAAITENLLIAGSVGVGLGSKYTPMAGAAGASFSW